MPIAYTVGGGIFDPLERRALESIPPDARSPDRDREELLAIVWALVLVECQLATWLRMAMIRYAVGAWLDAHGANVDLARRLGEEDDAYRARIPQVADAITVGALEAIADEVLAGAGVAGSSYIVEVWGGDAFFCDVSFCDVTEVLGPGPSIIVILPPTTSEGVARSVYEAVRVKKLGGVYHLVFPSVTGGKP